MRDKIIVKLQGGLGNQLFQYAYAKRMQQLFPEKRIVLDVSYFQKEHIRSLEIQKLSIDDAVEWSEKKDSFFDTMYALFRAEKSLLEKAGRRLRRWPLMERTGYYFNYSRSDYWTPRKSLRNIHLAGYFQNEEQIRPVRDHLISVTRPKSRLGEKAEQYLEKIRKGRSIGISVRAGQDYMEMGWNVCSREYYLEGIRKLAQNGENSRLFVFSDCVDKVREEDWFGEYDVTFVEGCTTAESLYLLTQCSDFVIANSTFSWWGAYMGRAKDKRVIAPEYFIDRRRTRESGLHVDGFRYLNNQTGNEEEKE